MKEIWKDIVGFEGLYQVSNLGKIKSLPKLCGHSSRQEKILKLHKSRCGYLKINLFLNGKYKTFNVHRLVAQAFIDNPNNLPCVNHIDGNKENNIVNNLEWCTIQENNIHAFKTGLKQPSYKPIIATNLQTGEEIHFKSLEEATITLKVGKSNISKVCRGKAKSLKGYTFKYTEE